MNVELMKQAIAVAVIQLFEGYPGDVLKKFTLEELEGFCEITEPLRPKQVEDIYRNAWDYIRAALSAPERKPMTLDEIKSNPVISYFGVESGEKIVRAVEAFHDIKEAP